jgi:3-hydroxyisobutyrate dehydrogenase
MVGEVVEMKIGVAGIGRMGAAIAARLIEVGHTVTVWNRSADKTQPLADAGAAVAASPTALAEASDAVITILTDSAALDQVFNGADGLLRASVAGKLFIEMSTVPPATSRALADKVRAAGAVFVECPVGGTIGPARQGKLLGLMGATDADAARAMPILEQLCRRVEHVGPPGAGALMKLAVNLPLMIAWQAYGEAFALARDLNVGGDRLLDLFAETSGANNALKGRAPMIAAMFAGRDSGPVTFDIVTAIKDLRTMLAEGEARGVSLPLLERTLGCFEDAVQNGFGSRDASMMPVYWAQRTH